jgi:enediyne biosynthesis protein E4
MIIRGSQRWLLSGLVTTLLLLISWIGARAVSEWRLRTDLDLAARDLGAGNAVRSRERLARLAERWPAHPQVLFRLGESELACGRPDAAFQAWARIPRGSPQAAEAGIRRAQLALQSGQFTLAEEVLKDALDETGPQSGHVRHLLLTIMNQQGRIDEARRLIEARWFEFKDAQADEAVAVLREHIALDFETVPLEGNLAFLQALELSGTGDDGYWLARANLASRSGRLDEAARWLDASLLRRPQDPVVWRAKLDWAEAAGRVDRVGEALAHLPPDSLTSEKVARLRAWLAARRGDAKRERRALDELIKLDPADSAALDRLSELAFQSNEQDFCRRLRDRKAVIDRGKDRYRRLLKKNHLKDDADEMGTLAEQLGRTFEANAFLTLSSPGNVQNIASPAKPQERDYQPANPGDSRDTALSRFFKEDFPSAKISTAPATSSDNASVRFANDAEKALFSTFRFDNGETPVHQMPEMSAGGIGLIDYDGDGWLDVIALQGGPFPPRKGAVYSGDRLFRNRRDGTWEDVTGPSRIGTFKRGYGHGVSVGDFDNDGHPDLFITRWGSYALYRNRGDGTFEDVTEKAGLGGNRDWPTSSAFADLDNDGDLDLYVCHYGAWDPDHPKLCKDPTGLINTSCDPRSISSLPDHVFRNDSGRFVDVTAEAGIIDRDGRGLGVVAADVDGDGLIDLFVANDTTANYLFRNLGGFRFEEVGQAAGVAANTEGGYQAGMGVACGDLDGDGRPDLAVTNFYGESTTLFHNMGQGFFADHTAAIGLAAASRYVLGFGVAFLDADNDGRLDLLTANGHVNDLRPHYPYQMTARLYLGGPRGTLTEVTDRAGPAFEPLHVGRGLAVGDLDNDGRIDALMVSHNEPLIYFHNRTESDQHHFVTLRLQGKTSNRDGVGAVVTLVAAGRKQVAPRLGGGSYQSAGDPRLHFGLGTSDRVESVDVRWPSGRVDRFRNLAADRGYRLIEGDESPKLLEGFRH